VLRVESGDERVAATTWNAILHVSAGWDPYALVDQGERSCVLGWWMRSCAGPAQDSELLLWSATGAVQKWR
jgi:hypothetical protein